jgi:hypothetical protein
MECRSLSLYSRCSTLLAYSLQLSTIISSSRRGGSLSCCHPTMKSVCRGRLMRMRLGVEGDVNLDKVTLVRLYAIVLYCVMYHSTSCDWRLFEVSTFYHLIAAFIHFSPQDNRDQSFLALDHLGPVERLRPAHGSAASWKETPLLVQALNVTSSSRYTTTRRQQRASSLRNCCHLRKG